MKEKTRIHTYFNNNNFNENLKALNLNFYKSIYLLMEYIILVIIFEGGVTLTIFLKFCRTTLSLYFLSLKIKHAFHYPHKNYYIYLPYKYILNTQD